ncbi:hypothetical protein SAMN05216228_102835 [Rhizobium tibeticum]|uniref:Uncharacterized protein n=1 Tax=Rhizobium tibeticum TaxID=501024 RepID=A0A1H8TCM4_9HYPH|nr:hypothetical protein RTCCBAU85039_5136 [Rhizobium tibeticum]SEO88575.1 hypothetical protein SAMN05216228_102835 [Rhizobium tibeticum]
MLILRNEMRSLRHRLGHEQMIEGIAVMKRKSSKSNKMSIRNVQPIETLLRQDRKNLVQIGIKLADPQLHGDFPQGEDADQNVVLGIADKATRMLPHFPSSFSHHNKACESRSNLTPRLPLTTEHLPAGCRSHRQL